MSLYIIPGTPGIISEVILVMAPTLKQALDYANGVTGDDRDIGYVMCDVNGEAQHPYGCVSKALQEYVQIHNVGS